MSEKRYTPDSGGNGGGAAQNNKRLSKITPDELIEEMVEKWDTMDDKDFDPQLIDSYLAALDKRDPASSDFNAEASLSAFHEKHAVLFEQMEPVEVSSKIMIKPRRYRRWRALRLIAATVAVMLSCMITAQALGIDVFGAIARWTVATFHFESASETETSIDISSVNEYSSLQEALSAYGVTEMVAPKRYPNSFQVSDIKVTPANGSAKFQAAYDDGDKFFTVTVWQFESAEDANGGTFEKDTSVISIYDYGGVKHYIMSNNEQYRAAWTNKNFMCSISGDLSETELKDMIKSIYER